MQKTITATCCSEDTGCRLHKAARELLEAANAILGNIPPWEAERNLGGPGGFGYNIQRLRAAIAKAEGQTLD